MTSTTITREICEALPSLVSVIVPCYNQGRFLGEAVASAQLQSLYPHEIVVVDDGSSDDSARIAKQYSGIKLIRQQNLGLSAARNAGLRASTGDYVVFLDADDRLMPNALEIGVNCLDGNVECAFVYGKYANVTMDGTPLPSTPRQRVLEDNFLDLLRGNYIGMHATVMYRRAVLDLVHGFDTSLPACEDYDLFLRIAKNFPIRGHKNVVAEYRQHGANMSCNPDLMLKTSLSVLRSQWKFVRKDPRAREAYREGIENFQTYYGSKLLKQLRSRAKERQWKLFATGAFAVLRYYPSGVLARLSANLIQQKARAPKIMRSRRYRNVGEGGL